MPAPEPTPIAEPTLAAGLVPSAAPAVPQDKGPAEKNTSSAVAGTLGNRSQARGNAANLAPYRDAFVRHILILLSLIAFGFVAFGSQFLATQSSGFYDPETIKSLNDSTVRLLLLAAIDGVGDLVGFAVSQSDKHPLLTALRLLVLLAHIAGLVIGFGATLLSAFYALHHMHSSDDHALFSSEAILSLNQWAPRFGIKLLFISGALLLASHWLLMPQALGDAKIWAKIGIIGLLLLNAQFINRHLMPLIETQRGTGQLLNNSDIWALSATISPVILSLSSWGFVMLLSRAGPTLNTASAHNLLMAFFIISSAAIAIIVIRHLSTLKSQSATH